MEPIDELIAVFVGSVLLSIAGCVLGLVGVVTARRARAEVAALRGERDGTTRAPQQTLLVPEALLQAARAAPPPKLGPQLGPELAPEPGEPLPSIEPVMAATAEPKRPAMDIELLLTQRWGVWVGAVALLLAGVFLVRYAVAHELLGPGVRCALAGALGLALVGGAEWLRRRPASTMPFADYAPAALAAGGVGALFVAAYGAGPLYGLVSLTAGFVLLAAAGVAGLALSLRFGPLVGAVGLAAAFITPALVATADPSLPGLFAYLLFVSAASWAVVRLTAWTWLGWAAAAGGAIWVWLATGAPEAGVWAAGLFVPAASALTLGLLPGRALEHPIGRRFAWAPMLMLGLAGLWLVGAVGEPWMRLGLLLLGPVAIVKGWVEPRLAWLPMLSAGIAVLTLLVWAVPEWQATGEAIRIEGVVQAVLPGAWAPEAILPLLETAGLVGLAYAAVGLVGERWHGDRPGGDPLPWAALVAAVPVILLAMTYAQVGRFQPEAVWALMAGALAGGLVAAAGLARRGAVRPLERAGVHAAGAVAALALGCAIVLEQAWLTVAVALMLPGLAWIEGATGLSLLRRVALVVAGVVLARLLLNPWVASYAVGATPVLNGLLVAYGIPAACFGAASRMFRARRDDVLVAVLEAGAVAFGVLLLLLEVHHAAEAGDWTAAETGFGELGWQVTGLGSVAVLLQWLEVRAGLAGRTGRPVLRAAWRVVGSGAMLGGVALLLWNPFVTDEGIGAGLLLNGLVPAYLFPAALAVTALRMGRVPRVVVGVFALASGFMWVSSEVRQVFHPGMTALSGPEIGDAELWAYSGAWLVMAAGLMGAGAVLRLRVLRLAGLGLTALVVAKVFLVDMAGLDGLWRVLSFLGLGLGLIGLGAVYRRFGAPVATE